LLPLPPHVPPHVPQAYHEFQRYAFCGNHVDTYAKVAAAKAYDHLLSAGLIMFVDPRWVWEWWGLMGCCCSVAWGMQAGGGSPGRGGSPAQLRFAPACMQADPGGWLPTWVPL
jgi:hypothetical protein